ncbi:MAG: hypothetical protein KDJ73_08840 [Notoacmeibacter sp.]|nr:hypothetical protein [Notoacmeibacter sp.]MCC0031737.1 hypothetical protein [Brucellaceae bacterium]
MIRKSLAAAAAMLVSGGAACAGAPDWKAVLAGVDGVITYCDSSTRQKYAETMCKAVSDGIAKALEETGLPVRHTGIVLTGSASPEKTPSEEATASLKMANGISHPLLAGIVLKGTDDGNPAIYMRVQFTVPVTVPPSGANPGFDGEILVLERAVVGNGPKKRLPAAQIAYIEKQIAPVLDEVRAALKAP